MNWIDEKVTAKNFDYIIDYNQFLEPKAYRCLSKNTEYNSPWFQVGLWCTSEKQAMENGDQHNERLI